MEFTVREVREEDAEAIAVLLNSIIEAGVYTVIDQTTTAADQQRFIRELPERAVYSVAVGDRAHEVLGVQDVLPHSGESRALRHVGEISTFVSPACHRSGVGRALMRETVRRAERAGYRKLIACIRADNPGAVSFYLSQGFRIIGTVRGHALVRGQYLDEVLTERLIG